MFACIRIVPVLHHSKNFQSSIHILMPSPNLQFLFVDHMILSNTWCENLDMTSISAISLHCFSWNKFVERKVSKISLSLKLHGNGPLNHTMSPVQMQVATSYRMPGPLNLCDHHKEFWTPGSEIGISVPSIHNKHLVFPSQSLNRFSRTITLVSSSAIASAKRFTYWRKVSRLLHPVMFKWTGSLLFTFRNTKVQRRCFGFARFEIFVVGSNMFHNSATVRKETPSVAWNMRCSESEHCSVCFKGMWYISRAWLAHCNAVNLIGACGWMRMW